MTAVHDHMTAVHDHMTAIHDHMTAVHNHMTAIHDHMTAVRDHMTAVHDHMTAVHDHMTAVHDHMTLYCYTGKNASNDDKLELELLGIHSPFGDFKSVSNLTTNYQSFNFTIDDPLFNSKSSTDRVLNTALNSICVEFAPFEFGPEVMWSIMASFMLYVVGMPWKC